MCPSWLERSTTFLEIAVRMEEIGRVTDIASHEAEQAG